MVLAALLTGNGASSRIAGSKVPAGRTYFTMFVGLREPLDLGADCLEFTEDEICPSGGVSGIHAGGDLSERWRVRELEL
jgi:hypothetical protein